MPVYIAPRIVELTSDLTIAVSVIPTEGNSALIIYTCDIENEQELSTADDWITDIKSNFIICDNAKISVNGFYVPDEDKKVQCITDVMLMYEDGSFLTLENNTQETEKLYGDEAFSMWTSHEQLQPDNQNRKAYVQVKNDIRYTLYTAPENSEILNQYISCPFSGLDGNTEYRKSLSLNFSSVCRLAKRTLMAKGKMLYDRPIKQIAVCLKGE